MTSLSPRLAFARPNLWDARVPRMDAGPEATFAVPAGTVTFLLTDIEASTQLWERAASAMPGAVARHYEILDEAIAAHGGVRPVEQGEGDSVVGAFSRAGCARGRGRSTADAGRRA